MVILSCSQGNEPKWLTFIREIRQLGQNVEEQFATLSHKNDVYILLKDGKICTIRSFCSEAKRVSFTYSIPQLLQYYLATKC